MSRISSKNQVTLPVDELRAAGLAAGDEIHVRAAGRGVLLVETRQSLVDRFAGVFDDSVYPRGYLERLRDEWER
jgi:bifunctional DNA-binding transcriptional regulator/antitoxin component of YhaV-PrlF toxin-antitoxin module